METFAFGPIRMYITHFMLYVISVMLSISNHIQKSNMLYSRIMTQQSFRIHLYDDKKIQKSFTLCLMYDRFHIAMRIIIGFKVGCTFMTQLARNAELQKSIKQWTIIFNSTRHFLRSQAKNVFKKKKNVLIQSCVLLCFRIVIYNLEQLYNLHNHYMSNILLGLLVMQSKSNYALFLILFVDI